MGKSGASGVDPKVFALTAQRAPLSCVNVSTPVVILRGHLGELHSRDFSDEQKTSQKKVLGSETMKQNRVEKDRPLVDELDF